MKKNCYFLFPVLAFMIACSADRADFENAQKQNSVEAYARFIKKHPESKLVTQARDAAEALDFEAVKARNTTVSLEEYLSQKPQSKFRNAVEERLEELRFQLATKDITKLKMFLETYPKSRFISEAKLKVKELLKSSLGNLARVEQSKEVKIQLFCFNNGASFIKMEPGQQPSSSMIKLAMAVSHDYGFCAMPEKARDGSTYVILTFTGEASRQLPKEAFAATSRSRSVALIDDGCWLSDETGKTYKYGFQVSGTTKIERKLAFEIPIGPRNLIWHSQEQLIPLDVLSLVESTQEKK